MALNSGTGVPPTARGWRGSDVPFTRDEVTAANLGKSSSARKTEMITYDLPGYRGKPPEYTKVTRIILPMCNI